MNELEPPVSAEISLWNIMLSEKGKLRTSIHKRILFENMQKQHCTRTETSEETLYRKTTKL